LNQLPEVRRFIVDSGNADMYTMLNINFVHGHHPFLLLFDDNGAEEERKDLAGYSFDGLKELFESLDFKRKEAI